MIRTWLMTAMALSMMTGVAAAQSSTTSTTSTQSTMPAPAPSAASVTSSRETTNSDGVVTDQTQTYTSGTVVAPTNETTRKTTETTVTR
jgi:cytochrome oxidase Cu insertion factor (SCO1/SenC/PrrC family)